MIKKFLPSKGSKYVTISLDKNFKENSINEKFWLYCKGCNERVFRKDIEENLYVCPNCGRHYSLKARNRVKLLIDPEFMMGSMGSVVGDKITYAIEYAVENNLPVIICSASGGARMQEGMLSLMQMAKTSQALAKLEEKALPYISILTDPTTGGVTASFAMLGDIIISEPNTLIGFAGPRVIEQTIKQKLPEGFQTSEFLLEHGFIDMIVDRRKMKEVLYEILNMHR